MNTGYFPAAAAFLLDSGTAGRLHFRLWCGQGKETDINSV